MIVLLSPSKRLDFESLIPVTEYTEPEMLEDAEQLIKVLKKYSKAQIARLMDISASLATLNYGRYQQFHTPFTSKNARPALLAFKGDVYEGMDAIHYSKQDFAFAQKHLRILSGLYGLLRPLDLIQPYRLEMGTLLKTAKGKDLYAFWGGKITEAINTACKESRSSHVINLASEEYFHAVKPDKLSKPLINMVFKEKKGSQLKIIGLLAKKARGVMANYIITQHLTRPEQLKGYREGGYRFQTELSDESHWVFAR